MQRFFQAFTYRDSFEKEASNKEGEV